MPTVNSKESVHSIKIPLLATNKRVGDEPLCNVPSTSQVMEAPGRDRRTDNSCHM